MGTRALVYTCVFMGKVSATCLRSATVFRPSACVCGGGGCRLCESEGAQGTCVATAGLGISVETRTGVQEPVCRWVEVVFECEKWSLWSSVEAPGGEASS